MKVYGYIYSLIKKLLHVLTILTISFHVYLQTFCEPARLTLVSTGDVDDASAIFFTNVV